MLLIRLAALLPRAGSRPARPAFLAASVLAVSALVVGGATASAAAAATASAAEGAATAARTALPSPNLYDLPGTPEPLDATTPVSLRVYLAGQHAAGLGAAALAVSTPHAPGYGHYLTAAQYRSRYAPSAAQVGAVTRWLTAAGMKVTAKTAHYLGVDGSVAAADRAFDTHISQYVTTTGLGGTSSVVAAVGGFSVPATLGADVATVTGIDQTVPPGSSADPGHAARATEPAAGTTHRPASATGQATPATQRATPTTGPAAGYQCSQYWGQHVEKIPAAYGRTTAPTQLCGYTPQQLRQAYGITRSADTGKGATVAIVLAEAWPTIEADANRFFASHGIAGFAPGQFTENFDSQFTSTCGPLLSEPGADADPEQALDVETVHIAAPDAKVVFVGADCDPSGFGESPLALQDLLDATTRVVDGHLADVVSSSWGSLVSTFSPADMAAWSLVFEQGALEGIGFDYSSGDGGSIGPDGGLPSSAQFPAADPWVTAVGGTSLAIGKNGSAVADYPWGDNVTQVNAARTGYAELPPGDFEAGSGGGVSAVFAQPRYQRPVVPAPLATDGGAVPARRVVPDIAANAGNNWLVGFTGAAADGGYAQVDEAGGTSGSTPLIAGLEADAIQAAGHPLGFINPVLYSLDGTPAIRDVPAVSAAHPPIVIGESIYSEGDNNLTTLGEDGAPLQSTAGYDDVTGLGAPTASFVTAFPRR
jgi:subtilase family serine protease